MTRILPDPKIRPLMSMWPEAAEWLDIGKTTAYRLAKEGAFPIEVLQIGGKLKVRTADLRRYLAFGTDDSAKETISA